ncbi:MAG: glycoside hydrolase family 32 protein [Aristaeellaceae bacterium]
MRPVFHFTPAANWINDPNGLCQVDGVYHLYYQYNPHGSVWGDMHWGHAVSTDLLHWEDRPVAMAPAMEEGEIHCFSGGCCKDEAGRPHFFYTSVGRAEDGRDCVHGAEQWYAEPAAGDLNHLRQTREHALTDAIHGGMHVRDWRDPCVLPWKGQYLMVLGGCVEERGCVLLYTSTDMRTWTYRHILVQSEVADGIPWECPNLFPLDGRVALLYSPCAAVEVLVGDLDDDLHYHVETREALDPAGRQGFYAPQVFRDEQGRTILMGWMPEADGDERAVQRGYSGAMNLPRVLSVKDGYIHAGPLAEIWSLARETAQVSGRHYVASLACPRSALPLTLTLLASPDGREKTNLTLTAEGALTLDRSASSLDSAPDKSPICRTVRLDGDVNLFLAVDGSAIECCVNGQWLSGRVYPTDGESGGFRVEAAGPVTVRLGEVTENVCRRA